MFDWATFISTWQWRYRIAKILYHDYRELIKGRRNEYRILQAVRSLHKEKPWIKGVRFGTEDEDRQGIDLLVDTDIGRLSLQVKSSQVAVSSFIRKQKWRRFQGRKFFVGLVVLANKKDDDLRRQMDCRLQKWYQETKNGTPLTFCE